MQQDRGGIVVRVRPIKSQTMVRSEVGKTVNRLTEVVSLSRFCNRTSCTCMNESRMRQRGENISPQARKMTVTDRNYWDGFCVFISREAARIGIRPGTLRKDEVI